MHKPFTTGQAAKVAGLSVRMIHAACDSGQLPCWRVPGSARRRIERIELLRWMVGIGIPLDRFGQLTEEERAVRDRHALSAH